MFKKKNTSTSMKHFQVSSSFNCCSKLKPFGIISDKNLAVAMSSTLLQKPTILVKLINVSTITFFYLSEKNYCQEIHTPDRKIVGMDP
jgi:hypothetical protein